ncbi:MAG: diguanylate cyclase [Lachnospiraceae bacterium]|nr:diguanylate cyclase [Lachnospiraceae bacterium]
MDRIIIKRIISILAAALMFVFMIIMLAPTYNVNDSVDICRLTESFFEGDKGTGDHYDGSGLAKGETVIFSTILPSDKEYTSPCISFISDFCYTNVYVDGEEIFKYGASDERKGDFVPKKSLFVALPKDCAGKVLSVEITASIETNYNVNYFYYGDSDEVSKFFVKSRRFPLFMGIFVCVFGFFILITIPVLRGVQTAIVSMLFHGLLLMDLGIYFLGYNTLLGYAINEYSASLLEYASLFYLPFLVQGAMIFNDGAKRNKLTYFVMAVDFIAPTLVLIIHYSGFIYIQQMVSFSHILILFQGMYCIVFLIRCIKNSGQYSEIYGNRVYSFIIVIGVNIFFLTSYIDLASYYVIHSLGIIPQTSVKGAFILYGAIELVISMVISYFFQHIAYINEDSIRNNLEGIAYRDELTDISNRAYCEQVMARMTRKKMACMVVSIDLDGLKKVNDNLGHQIGDRMIKGFAGILKNVYANADLLGRMGGDEFIVIIKGRDIARCEGLLGKLKMEIERANRDETEFKYAASWGYASSHEVDSTEVKDIYMLADTRMYMMKDEHHQRMAELSAKEVMS